MTTVGIAFVALGAASVARGAVLVRRPGRAEVGRGLRRLGGIVLCTGAWLLAWQP
jgi:hypothetical protein